MDVLEDPWLDSIVVHEVQSTSSGTWLLESEEVGTPPLNIQKNDLLMHVIEISPQEGIGVLRMVVEVSR